MQRFDDAVMNEITHTVCLVPPLITSLLLAYFFDLPIISQFPPDPISKGGEKANMDKNLLGKVQFQGADKITSFNSHNHSLPFNE